MEQIKLEVGKTYEVRDPKYAEKRGFPVHHRICMFRGGMTHCMITDSNYAYMKDGRYVLGIDYELDLVRELTP